MNNKNIQKWNYPTTIYHGINSLDLIPDILVQNNINNPLIITDNFLATSDILNKLKNILNTHKINHYIFSELASDPDRDIVYQALDILKTNKNNSLIIVGGGSALDLGKAVSLMANHEHDLWQFEDGSDHYINIKPELILPSIAVPTTAGTGSEVGRVAVIIDNETINEYDKQLKRKKFIFHSNLIPKWVILDPVLTTSMPKKLSSATAMDALTHAIEALCVKSYHPLADGIAIEAIKLINNNILEVYNNPGNLTARGHMLSAATMAATAFQKGLGLVHSLSHPLGAIYKIHHGLLNAVLLPYVLEYNKSQIEDKMFIIVNALELQQDKNSTTSHSEIVINWILNLRNKLNIPHCLSAIPNHGIDINNKSEISLIISEALIDPSTPTNPVTPCYDNLMILFEKCFSGV